LITSTISVRRISSSIKLAGIRPIGRKVPSFAVRRSRGVGGAQVAHP